MSHLLAPHKNKSNTVGVFVPSETQNEQITETFFDLKCFILNVSPDLQSLASGRILRVSAHVHVLGMFSESF